MVGTQPHHHTGRRPGDNPAGRLRQEQSLRNQSITIPSRKGRGLQHDPRPTAARESAGRNFRFARGYFRIRWVSQLELSKAALSWRACWAAALARSTMLGGSSEPREREAEVDGAGALPAPPAIDFPAEGSDPKYDGKGPGIPRRPSPFPHPPSLSGGLGNSEICSGIWGDLAGSRLELGLSGAVRGWRRAGRSRKVNIHWNERLHPARLFRFMFRGFPSADSGLRTCQDFPQATSPFPHPVALSGKEHELRQRQRDVADRAR